MTTFPRRKNYHAECLQNLHKAVPMCSYCSTGIWPGFVITTTPSITYTTDDGLLRARQEVTYEQWIDDKTDDSTVWLSVVGVYALDHPIRKITRQPWPIENANAAKSGKHLPRKQ